MKKDIQISGLNLDIDTSVQEICKVSNSSSSNSRGILYLIVIISALSLIAVINTSPLNWSKVRLESVTDSVKYYQGKICSIITNNTLYDTCCSKCSTENFIKEKNKPCISSYYKDKLDFFIKKKEFEERNRIENFRTIRTPLFGSSFDVNNLIIIAGLALTLLLIILKFTLKRETNNLRIALNAITERYPDNANFSYFEPYIKDKNNEGLDKVKILSQINFTRRQHHYNFLSMNEILTKPPLKLDTDKESLLDDVLKYIFYFPFFVYLIIIANDLATINEGLAISKPNTYIGFIIGFISCYWLLILCYKCTLQEKKILSTFTNFKENNYKYIQK